MFIELEVLLTAVLGFGLFYAVVVPIMRPLFSKSSEDKRLEAAQEKARKAQKLLVAAELEAKALEAEVKADEIRENALKDKLK